MKKDWTEVLKQKVDAYVPDDMQLPGFEDLKKKMLAAGAGASASAGAGAGAGAPKGASVSMRRGLKWVAAAASLAAVVAGGALLLRDRGGEQPSGLADAGVQEVVSAENAAEETAPVLEETIPAQDVIEEVSTPSNNTVKPTVVKPVSIIKKGVQPLLADAGNEAEAPKEVAASEEVKNAVPAEDVTAVPDAEKSEAKRDEASQSEPSAQESKIASQESQTSSQDSKSATEPTQNIGLANLGSDPFAEPVEPVRKQLKRFSLGASGILAANASARGDKANPNDLRITTDREGNKYFDFGAPEIQYHYTAPVSGGISLRYHFTNQFYAETGMRFTYLRTWVTPSGAQQNLLFAGIPVGLGAKFLSLGNFDLYGSAYGMGSKCIYGSETPKYPSNYNTLDEIPLMWSVGISPGAEYHITPLVSLYAEPTLSYYFKNEKAPNTLYKDNPLYFTVNVGVRFNM